mmetsp:Transcript_20993/g.39870  ORF Transcript_20993/g.39870 Transcript_20993/m.39870 type:complete len:402 (+) Transcript_20993:174-1379(+)
MRKNGHTLLLFVVLLSTFLPRHVHGLDDSVQSSLLGVFSALNEDPTTPVPSDSNCPPDDMDDSIDELVDDSESLQEALAQENEDEATTAGNNHGIRSEFFGTFRKLGVSWGHIIRSYIRIIGLAGGKELDGDVFADTADEALLLLQDMTHDMDFTRTPYNIHGHTVDDLLRVFLRWAETNGAPADTKQCPRKGGANGRHGRINVSKAHRRLEMYVQWIQEVEEDIMKEPITDESVAKARDVFALQLAHDDCHRLVWWFDLSMTDVEAVKALPPRETRRFFVWFAHLMMFDERAQDHGLVFVSNNLSRVGFFSFMTMLPLQVGIKLDEFMICVVPLSTKLVSFMNTPSWAHFAFRILKTFLNKDMKSRVWFIDPKSQHDSLESALGHAYVDLVHETLPIIET